MADQSTCHASGFSAGYERACEDIANAAPEVVSAINEAAIKAGNIALERQLARLTNATPYKDRHAT